MPIRLRITFLFALVVFIILGMVCGAVYYFTYTTRIDTIRTRLANRAISTARLLSQSEIFNQHLIQRIDSLTTIALKNKIVQAYDYKNHKIYNYSDKPSDTLTVDGETLNEARVNGIYYFTKDKREAVAYHYTDANVRIVMVAAGEDEEGKQTLYRLKYILFLCFLGGVIFALCGGYFFSKGLLQPLKKITGEVMEISAQNLTRRIPAGTIKDEWYELATTLNDLLNRLQESFEVQRRFIANASHELSTPLTAISSQLEVSLQRDRTADEYQKVMLSVLQDVQHLSKLTQALLEFAKASGNSGGIEIEPVRMDEILMQMPAEMQKQNKAFTVLLHFEEMPENEEDLLVYGNQELLFTAIKNIVSNACKYSPDQYAHITFCAGAKQLLIAV
ncbi:MAG: HAMP domain-containing protein, partial [Flavisolibacter sp.]|nr:HAMP domain-containing protein [Flavisolibacter sp.]